LRFGNERDVPDDEDLNLTDYIQECPKHMIPICEACGYCHACIEEQEPDDSDGLTED
jgi:hypothetical protein